MKQMNKKTREAQATYAPNLASTCLEYWEKVRKEERKEWGYKYSSNSMWKQAVLYRLRGVDVLMFIVYFSLYWKTRVASQMIFFNFDSSLG